MSVTLIVGSQAQLADGLPWLDRFAKLARRPPSIVVLGQDHQALARHAKSELAEISIMPGQVDLVDEDVEQLLAHLSAKRCHTLVMVAGVGNERTQSDLFERCQIKAVWLRSKQAPPESDAHIFALDGSSPESTEKISRRLFAMSPSLQLVDRWPAAIQDDVEARKSEALRLEAQRCDEGDAILITFGPQPSKEPHYPLARALLSKSQKASVVLVSRRQNWERSLRSRIRYWASKVAEPMDRDARVELATSLAEHSQPNLEFLGLISAASMLAAFGLLQNSAAVIIGAMLIAPLMTPILGAGLSLTHGNRPLFHTSLVTIAIGFAGAFLSSFLFGLLVRLVQTPEITPEMWGRSNPSPLDFCVGFVGGIAASYARTRSHLSPALAGAAIAAALVPPIATAGLQAAFGAWHTTEQGWPVFGPLILVSVNVLTIMIGSSFVLYARGVRIERVPVSSSANGTANRIGEKWATRMTVLLIALVLVVLVWILHLERLFQP